MEVGIFMAKYSFELKKKVVEEYLRGEGGKRVHAQKHNIQTPKLIILYDNTIANIPFEKKLYVVELYLSSEISYQELALQEGICNPAMISNWVNRFRAAGPEALRPHKKGRKKTLNKPEEKSTNSSERIIDTSAEHVKELEDELLKLRIENAFLKELRRLRLEDEAKMRERRLSSKASEESSN